jgi:1,4-alpha-glucan branching enzyme
MKQIKKRTDWESPRHAEVKFALDGCAAEAIYVCGDFNDWHTTCLRMIRNPETARWEKWLVLPPGRYEYKFLVDGNWVHDPRAQSNVPNTYGTLNSVVEVRL